MDPLDEKVKRFGIALFFRFKNMDQWISIQEDLKNMVNKENLGVMKGVILNEMPHIFRHNSYSLKYDKKKKQDMSQSHIHKIKI